MTNLSAIDNGPFPGNLSESMRAALGSVDAVVTEGAAIQAAGRTLAALASRGYVASINGRTATLTTKGAEFSTAVHLARRAAALLEQIYAAGLASSLVTEERSGGLFRVAVDGEQLISSRFERIARRHTALHLAARAAQLLDMDSLGQIEAGWVLDLAE